MLSPLQNSTRRCTLEVQNTNRLIHFVACRLRCTTHMALPFPCPMVKDVVCAMHLLYLSLVCCFLFVMSYSLFFLPFFFF